MGVTISGGKNWKKVLESIAQKAETLRAGVLEGAMTEDGEPVAPYAFFNEFGASVPVTEKSRRWFGAQGVHLKKSADHITVPSRPFMRSTVKNRSAAWAKGFSGALRGKVPDAEAVRGVLESLGRQVQGDIVAAIASNMPPENSPLTRRLKDKDGKAGKGTLQDKGNLIHSIDYEVES